MTKPKNPDGMTVGTFTSTEAGNEIEYFICQHCIEGNHPLCTGKAWDRQPGFKQLGSCECQSEKDGYKVKKDEGTMDSFLKFLEDNCPGDDAHSGGGETRKSLLERCGMCAEIYEAHQKDVAGLRKALASVTVGFCRFCNCGGDAKLQNHLPNCEVAALLGVNCEHTYNTIESNPKKCLKCGADSSAQPLERKCEHCGQRPGWPHSPGCKNEPESAKFR